MPGIRFELERRFVPLANIELRASGDGEEMVIEGRPILYNRMTTLYADDEYELREVILSGAATDAMASGEEVLLWNHSSSMPMARRSNKTLEAIEDGLGVRIRADVAKTKWGRDGYEAIKNGVVDAMSFGFYLNSEGYKWEREKKDGKVIDTRTISKFSRIVDYSPVTYPAYKDTDVAARSKELALRSQPSMEDPAAPDGDERSKDAEATKAVIRTTLDEIEERTKKWKS